MHSLFFSNEECFVHKNSYGNRERHYINEQVLEHRKSLDVLVQIISQAVA